MNKRLSMARQALRLLPSKTNPRVKRWQAPDEAAPIAKPKRGKADLWLPPSARLEDLIVDADMPPAFEKREALYLMDKNGHPQRLGVTKIDYKRKNVEEQIKLMVKAVEGMGIPYPIPYVGTMDELSPEAYQYLKDAMNNTYPKWVHDPLDTILGSENRTYILTVQPLFDGVAVLPQMGDGYPTIPTWLQDSYDDFQDETEKRFDKARGVLWGPKEPPKTYAGKLIVLAGDGSEQDRINWAHLYTQQEWDKDDIESQDTQDGVGLLKSGKDGDRPGWAEAAWDASERAGLKQVNGRWPEGTPANPETLEHLIANRVLRRFLTGNPSWAKARVFRAKHLGMPDLHATLETTYPDQFIKRVLGIFPASSGIDIKEDFLVGDGMGNEGAAYVNMVYPSLKPRLRLADFVLDGGLDEQFESLIANTRGRTRSEVDDWEERFENAKYELSDRLPTFEDDDE